jgi:trimethylamine--corrinoid protein Co-methyltransferase
VVSFFGTGNTIACYEDAFYQPFVFEGTNFDQWLEDGSPDAAERAHHVCQRVLEEFEAPELSADRKDALDDFVARRTQESGAPLD